MNVFLHDILGSVIYHALLGVAVFRWHDIFGLKDRLSSTRPFLFRKIWNRFYDEYFERKGGYVGLVARLGDGIQFPHGFHGIFISRDAVIGTGVVIFQNVTIGANRLPSSRGKTGSPVIGSHVLIGAGAKVIGPCKIGDHVVIGAGAVVVHDVPSESTVVAQPVRVIPCTNSNRKYVW